MAATEALMLAHGFTVELLADMVRVGAGDREGRAHARRRARDQSGANTPDHG